MTCYIFVVLAAFFNACMDAFENENYFESIFRYWDQRFYYKRESWKYAKRIGGYHLDAWHISKTLMIVCYCFTLLYPPQSDWWVTIINYAVIYNIAFYLFYHKLFKIK